MAEKHGYKPNANEEVVLIFAKTQSSFVSRAFDRIRARRLLASIPIRYLISRAGFEVCGSLRMRTLLAGHAM